MKLSKNGVWGKSCWTALVVALAMLLWAGNGLAADWSTTEVQLQLGTLEVPFVDDEDTFTEILTFQHASGWKYGDNFFFVDLIRTEDENIDLYGEWYPTVSFGKIAGKKSFGGPLRDIGLIMGLNFGADPNVLKYLPGVRLSWDVPGFAFFNTDFTAYMEGKHEDAGGAPAETDSWMIDVSWALPFKISSLSFSFEGHMEYIAERETEEGGFEVAEWILAQPQLRLDVGELLFKSANQLFAGIEYQYWMNKLGDEDTDESAVQALVVWRF